MTFMKTYKPISMIRVASITWWLTFALVQLSCEHDSPTSSENAGLSYFPMQVGNRWVYESANTQSEMGFELKIVGTTHVSGKEYFIFERRDLDSGFVDSTLYRGDGDGKIYIYNAGQERLYVDFALAPGSPGQATSIIPGRWAQRMAAERYQPAHSKIA